MIGKGSLQEELISRVRNSERYLRIYEAEEKMKETIKKKKIQRKKLKEREKNGLNFIPNDDDNSHNNSHSHSSNNNSNNKSNEEGSMFTSHVLNDDPEVAKFLLYNEVIYPKLFSKETTISDPKETLDKMWVSGFLDRAARDKEKCDILRKNKSKQNSISSSTLPLFLQNEGLLSINSDSSSLISSSSVGSIPSIDKFDPTLLDLPKRVKKSKSDALQEAEALKAPSFESDSSSSLSVNDQYRLKLLKDSLKNYEKKKEKKSKQLIKSLNVYESHNRAIKLSKLPPKIYPLVNSHEVDEVFERERIENQAAKKIQKAYIHSCVIHKLRRVFLCMAMAVRIQKHMRGYLIRKRVAEWFVKKSSLMIKWQCRIRRWLSNKHLEITFFQERNAAIIIQSMIRKKIAYIYVYKKKRNLAAIRIQCLWRGICSRIRSDRIWLNHVVIPIQVLIRKMVSRMRYKRIHKEMNTAALQIQKCFRSWRSIQNLSKKLNQREDIYREYTLAMLTAEEEWADDTILKLSHRLDKKEVRNKLQIVTNDYQKAIEDIHFKENDYLELRRQRDILSARAIQQGWLGELDTNIVTTRNEITAFKMKLIFKKQVLLNSLDTQLTEKVEEIESIARYRDMISDCREQEIEDNRIRNFYRNSTQLRKSKRQAIANEKRKWMVKFYTQNGKPDKLRRPGRKWEPEAFAGPEKMTYCSASGVNLMVGNQERAKGIKEGSKESVEQVINELSLQTYLQQVQHYENLLNPIYGVMQGALGGKPGSLHPAESGWGPIGDQLPEALENINAIPKEWKTERIEYKKNQLREQNEIKRKQRKENDERKRRLSESQQLLKQTDGLSAFNDYFDQEGEVEVEVDKQQIKSNEIFVKKQLLKNKQHYNEQQTNESTNIQSQIQSQTQSQSTLKSKSSYPQLQSQSQLLNQNHNQNNEQIEDFTSPPKQKTQKVQKLQKKSRNRERSLGSATIPWSLLDELEGEKKKFEGEKSFLEFYHKF